MGVRKVNLPADLDKLEQVLVKNLAKKVEYVLTGDFWPHGGSIVTLHKTVPAHTVWTGTRGLATIVRDGDKNEFFLAPGSYLFKEKATPLPDAKAA